MAKYYKHHLSKVVRFNINVVKSSLLRVDAHFGYYCVFCVQVKLYGVLVCLLFYGEPDCP